VVLQYAKDNNVPLKFYKVFQSWKLFRTPLTMNINRVVKFGPVLTDLTSRYVSPNETVAFLPGNCCQRLFDAVCVRRDRAGRYDVYFFRVANSYSFCILLAHGAVFLATLFPEYLCHQKEDIVETWVRMKIAAEKRQKEAYLQDEIDDKMRGDRYYIPSPSNVSAPSDNESLGLSFYECLFPELPPAHLINRPKKIRLHFYIVAAKNPYFNLSMCEMHDIECMSQFDSHFTKDKVHVAYMKCKI